MRATGFGIAVASLVAVSSLPAQRGGMDTSTAAAVAAQDTTQRIAPAPVQPRGDVSKDTIRFGGRTIAAGQVVSGPVVVAAGDLHVLGTVQGTAIVIAGDIVVDSGGRITGDAISVLGGVRHDAGSVLGTARSYEGSFAWFADERPESDFRPRESTSGAVSLALGWLVVVLLIGIGVLVFAGSYLEGVTDVLEQSFWRSFLVGLAGEVAIIPVCILLMMGLAITVVGILLIPFALVAYVVAVAGLFTIGFLAMAELTGAGIGASRAARLQERGRALRGLMIGIAVFLGMWVVAAAFQWSPIASGILRAVALAITWVAATAGFGAAILSRGGSRRDVAPRPEPVSDEMAVWQTPTPVTGVVAARRPTPAMPKERV
jgi:hypothetical protein